MNTYDELPSDVKLMCDQVDSELAAVGIDIEADMKATNSADELSDAPATVNVTRNKSVPESFGSRSKARVFVSSNPGYKVVDNGTDAENRWTVATTAKATTAKRPAGKKEIAMEVYAGLESSGTLKRSTFLSEMATRTGLSAKGASSYFYRIKGGKW